jgi:hypothetical protein
MSKKGFSGGLSTLLGESPKVKKTEKEVSGRSNPSSFEISDTPKRKVGRPKTQLKIITKTSEEGTKEGEIRATFIVKTELLEKLKAIAHYERTLIKYTVEKALEDAIAKYEKKGVLDEAVSIYSKKDGK